MSAAHAEFSLVDISRVESVLSITVHQAIIPVPFIDVAISKDELTEPVLLARKVGFSLINIAIFVIDGFFLFNLHITLLLDVGGLETLSV